MSAPSSSDQTSAGARDMQHEGVINPLSPPRRGGIHGSWRQAYVDGSVQGPSEAEHGGEGATLSLDLDRDLRALAAHGTHKSIMGALDRWFSNAAASLPPSSYKTWDQMQSSNMYMSQPDRHSRVRDGT